MHLRILICFFGFLSLQSCNTNNEGNKNKVNVGGTSLNRFQSSNNSCGGNYISGYYGTMLDPNQDGYISINPNGFSDCSIANIDEITEFEVLTNPSGCMSVNNTGTGCQVPWTAMPSFSETTYDLWSGTGCSKTDIVGDGSLDNHSLYYTIVDPDGQCNNGDELLITRLRTAQPVNGTFSYSILIDADNAIGANDPDGIQCDMKISNIGFEYEIVTDPNKKITVYDINGLVGDDNSKIATYQNDDHYMQSYACRSECNCNDNAVYHTSVIKLSDIGKSCLDKNFRMIAVTAMSGNGVVVSATSVSDIGGVAGAPDCNATQPNDGCGCCIECATGTSQYDCNGNFDQCIDACMFACATSSSRVNLPIELLSFIGEKDDNNVQLRWSTESETNNEYFELQKSKDGATFNAFARVDGAGNSTYINNYEYLDNNPYSGTNYYRLQQYDFDGTTTISNVIAVEFGSVSQLQVYPTVVRDILNVVLETKQAIKVPIIITSMNGQVVMNKTLNLQDGVNNEQLNLSHLSNGAYAISLDIQGTRKTIRFTVNK